MNDVPPGEMGSYQPSLPEGPSESFLHALHRISICHTALNRDTLIQKMISFGPVGHLQNKLSQFASGYCPDKGF